ncbi:Cysteine-rich receptor-like protein [Drosera capensis]
MRFWRILCCLPVFLCTLSIQETVAAPTFVYSLCFTFASNSSYQTTLDLLLSSLSSNATNGNGFYYTSIGSNQSNTLHGLFLCRGDDSSSICQDCVATATTDLPSKCPRSTRAIVWYEECMIRYSDESFYGVLDTAPMFSLLNTTVNTNDDDSAFMKVLVTTINDVALAAHTSGKRFATGEAKYTNQTLYALTQCTPDLSMVDCYTCLRDIIGGLPCNESGIVLCPGCYVRYAMQPFYQGISKLVKKSSSFMLKGICIPAASATLLICGIWIYFCKNGSNAEKLNIDEIRCAEHLQFDFNTIKIATSNFSAPNKLGEGGFGKVYKGTLQGGQKIAVKRLSGDSGQGTKEFKTEALLITKLQHKNLVKLLGFCIKAEEKILVYEFMLNSSLDKVLADPVKRASFQWETRFKVISGVARGLLYLHEDSRIKIIHRDLKSSNILLDETMNPKISDFGLAKLVGVDQTQGDTRRIMGTYGYMAPEYAMTGHFSDKSDIFSFGVIILEIVSGQRRKYFTWKQTEEALLHQAWRLWNEGAVLEFVDKEMCENFPCEEVIKCIHIGLLCIQEVPARRPKIGFIIALLNGEAVDIPSPTAPYYLSSSSIEASPIEGNLRAMKGDNQDQNAEFMEEIRWDSITTMFPR